MRMSSLGHPKRELTDSELETEVRNAIAGGDEHARNVAAGLEPRNTTTV